MLFKKKEEKNVMGLVLFKEVHSALSAEKAIKADGLIVKLVAPPFHLRKGCDLAVEIEIINQLRIERALSKNNIDYLSIIPNKDSLIEPLDIVKVTEFENAIMVKVANMKITFQKDDGTIVNISGGGCPDIPYLNIEMIGKKIGKVVRPRDLGFTLCALMLNRAYEECCEIFREIKC
jgi:hypothetical protein